MNFRQGQRIDIYDLYKPLRNAIRKLALLPSLTSCWNYQKQSNVDGAIKIHGVSDVIYVWELHALCKEVILHANGNKDALASPHGIAHYINHIRKLKEDISERSIKSTDQALGEVFQLAHQQARWQHRRDQSRIFRAFYIYNDPDLRDLFYSNLGLTAVDMATIALTIGGITKNKIELNKNQDYSMLHVSRKARDRFFEMTTKTLKDLRSEINKEQRYDQGWAYSWNPLEAYPLINIGNYINQIIWCPLPELLSVRITEGLFYDLLKTEQNFGNQYGKAFEKYVGKVLSDIFHNDKFIISGEQPYAVKKQQKHGADWIVSDDTGNLFFECKTRRLTQEAKQAANGDLLKRSIENLADAVVQLYKNFSDVVSGIAGRAHNGLPSYLFIVTYEDWYLTTPTVTDYLINSVKNRLMSENMRPELIEENPFFIVSIEDLEIAGQAIAYLGVRNFCSHQYINRYRFFNLKKLAINFFANEQQQYRQLFQEAWYEMFPTLSELIDKIPKMWPSSRLR